MSGFSDMGLGLGLHSVAKREKSAQRLDLRFHVLERGLERRPAMRIRGALRQDVLPLQLKRLTLTVNVGLVYPHLTLPFLFLAGDH